MRDTSQIYGSEGTFDPLYLIFSVCISLLERFITPHALTDYLNDQIKIISDICEFIYIIIVPP